MNISFIGAGLIARKVVNTLKKMEGVNLYAVSARDKGRAELFAREFGFEKSFGSYEEMLLDDNVGLVYINTTISHHAKHIEMCVNAGRPSLCEKAFTTTATEARRILSLSSEKRIFVGEALWTRYMPMAKTVRDIVNSGRLGEIVSLHANLGYPVGHLERLQSPELSGGALLDIGVYTLAFAELCFGDNIQSFSSTAEMSASGVDRSSYTCITYMNGRKAYLFSTFDSLSDRRGAIYGVDGYLVVENINNFEEIDIYNKDNILIERIKAPEQISGYEYQFECADSAIQNGEIECEEWSHKEIITLMEQMDNIRHSWGMYYPGEPRI